MSKYEINTLCSRCLRSLDVLLSLHLEHITLTLDEKELRLIINSLDNNKEE